MNVSLESHVRCTKNEETLVFYLDFTSFQYHEFHFFTFMSHIEFHSIMFFCVHPVSSCFIPSVVLQRPVSVCTENTTLFSRQSTLEDMDLMPENIPKTSERARPKLRKMYSMDMSSSSVDSGSSFMSRCSITIPPFTHSNVIAASHDSVLLSFMLPSHFRTLSKWAWLKTTNKTL